MRPILASAIATVCVSAVALTTAGSTQAAPGSPGDRRAEAIAHARVAAAAHAALGPGQGLVVKDAVLEANGASHVRFDRTYYGLPVVGGDFVIHQSGTGSYRSMSGR